MAKGKFSFGIRVRVRGDSPSRRSGDIGIVSGVRDGGKSCEIVRVTFDDGLALWMFASHLERVEGRAPKSDSRNLTITLSKKEAKAVIEGADRVRGGQLFGVDRPAFRRGLDKMEAALKAAGEI